MIEEVDDETLDVRTIVILIGHDHDTSVSQAVDIEVLLAVLETENLLDGLDLGILHDLIVCGLADVEKLTSKRKDTKVVTPDFSDTGDGERLGGVTFGENERAVLSFATTSVVGIFELGMFVILVRL